MPTLDLRAIVRARMAALTWTQAALAARMAPRWHTSPQSASSRLSRWLTLDPKHRRDMTSDALAELFAELGLDVTAAA